MLIVDDREENLTALEAVLADLNAIIVKARSGKEALQYVLKEDFAVILLDVQMPEMDGFEVATLIRGRERSLHTPLVFVTAARVEDADISHGFELGATDYIVKPFSALEIRAKVGAYIEIYEQRKELEKQVQEIERLNAELKNSELTLRLYNETLEDRVRERTEDLRKNETRYRSLVTATSQVVWLTNAQGEVVADIPSWRTFTGQTEQEARGRGWLNMLHPEDREQTAALWAKAVETHSLYETEFRLRRHDGKYRTIAARGVPVLEKDGSLREWVGTCTDITERKQAEQEMNLLQTLTQAINETGDLDEALSVMLKKVIEATGWLLGSSWLPGSDGKHLVCGPVWFGDGEGLAEFVDVSRSFTFLPGIGLPGRVWSSKQPIWIKDVTLDDNFPRASHARKAGLKAAMGFPIFINDEIVAVVDFSTSEGREKDERLVKLVSAVTSQLGSVLQRKKAEGRLAYLAYYDDLTGLPTRNLFIDRITQGIARTEYYHKLIAVMIIDVNRFRFINDTYGIYAGDAILKEIAERLTHAVREGDTVARLGNDHYGVLLTDVAQSENIIFVIEKIMKTASLPVLHRESEIPLSLSIGIAVYPRDGKDGIELLKNADLANAKANQLGRKSYQFYTEELDVRAAQFALMEKNLRNAIKREEFILHFQPYWDTNTKRMTGMEALVRWNSPEFGLVPPVKFIPVLEDTGLIIEVGEWILRAAVKQVKEWQDQGYPVVPISVNLSGIQFGQKGLVEMAAEVIKDVGLNPNLLNLEITETVFMQDIKDTYSILVKFKQIGISIGIDDFGTGYSSLSYLKKFPIDYLKIDISFVRELATDPDSVSIVKAIISMAHALNLKTIAEGVETEEQWKFLRLLSCDNVQGFYFSKPLPAADIKKILGTTTS